MTVSDIRFKRLGYVALNVTDVERSREFYISKVGLLETDSDSPGTAFLRCSAQHHDISLHRSDSPGLKRLGWEMESEVAFEAAREHLQQIGLEIAPVTADECAELGVAKAFRVEEPTIGAVFEFYIDMITVAPFVPTHTKIQRLGHAVLGSPDRASTERFLCDHLNFRVSDRIEGSVTFMRCFPNPYHHSLGVGGGGRSKLHHVNFMVSELADVGKATNRMKQGGVPIVYGIGKHPPSDSIFLYFLDPDGLTLEYSYGMEEFSEDAPRQPRDMAAGIESIDYWGGIPAKEMGGIGDIERLH